MGKSDRPNPHQGSEEVLQTLQIPDLPGSIVASPLTTRPIRDWVVMHSNDNQAFCSIDKLALYS